MLSLVFCPMKVRPKGSRETGTRDMAPKVSTGAAVGLGMWCLAAASSTADSHQTTAETHNRRAAAGDLKPQIWGRMVGSKWREMELELEMAWDGDATGDGARPTRTWIGTRTRRHPQQHPLQDEHGHGQGHGHAHAWSRRRATGSVGQSECLHVRERKGSRRVGVGNREIGTSKDGDCPRGGQ